MWIWEGTSSQAQSIRVVLVPEKQAYLIGRAAHPASDIVIDFDKSVSRTHATLQVNSEGVWFKDGGSRLGSFLNGTQIKDANQIKLKDGDELKLGAGATVFRLRQLSPVIVFSGVKSSTKAALTDRASAMGFTAFENFTPSCTHLIMTSLKITMKTVQAVAHGTHIVTDAWIKALDTNCKGFPYSFPNEADFVPTVREENLTKDQFVPNAKRKTLFNGKKFLFFDAEEIPIFGEIVAACGGTVVDCAEIVEKQDKQGIIDLIKKHKDPFVIAVDPDDPRFASIIQEVNTKDGIIYSLLYTSWEDHLKISTLVPQQSMVVEIPEPAKEMAAATTQQESVFVDDDDDDDLFQALFRKKGKAKAAGTQIPPTPLNPTITQKKPATQKPPLYIPQTLSIPPDSQILATQNSAIPSTAIPSSFSSSSSAVKPKQNLLSSRLGLTPSAAHSSQKSLLIPSTAIPNSQPAPPSNPSKFMPPPPPPAPKPIVHHMSVPEPVPAPRPVPTLSKVQPPPPPPPATGRPTALINKQPAVAHSSQLLKVTKFPTYSIDEDESVIIENEESFMIGDGEDAVPPSPVAQKTVPSAVAAAAAASARTQRGSSSSNNNKRTMDESQDDGQEEGQGEDHHGTEIPFPKRQKLGTSGGGGSSSNSNINVRVVVGNSANNSNEGSISSASLRDSADSQSIPSTLPRAQIVSAAGGGTAGSSGVSLPAPTVFPKPTRAKPTSTAAAATAAPRQHRNAATVLPPKQKELVPPSDPDEPDEDGEGGGEGSKNRGGGGGGGGGGGSGDVPKDVEAVVEEARGLVVVVDKGKQSRSLMLVGSGGGAEGGSCGRNYKRFRKNKSGVVVQRRPVALELVGDM